MYRLIVSDLDQTLLNDDKHVSPSDIANISDLKDVVFVLASGRGFVSLQNALKELGLYDREKTYTISLNGGILTENRNNRILSCEPLSFEDADFLFHKGKDLGLCVHIYVPEVTYVWGLTEEERTYTEGRIELTPIPGEDISFLKDTDIIKILFVNTDMDRLRQLRKDLDLDERFAVSFSANRYIEFNRKGVNKGSGLHKLCDLLDIDIRDSIGVGDSVNDTELLQEAGLSVCVANAVDEIRQICDVVLVSDNNHSPISEIIDCFIQKEDH